MVDIVYRYDPDNPVPEAHPATPAEAREILERGNHSFAHMLDRDQGATGRTVRVLNVSPQDLGIYSVQDERPAHRPFAIVIGCADARAPIELILGQGANDLFVVRVAGNVLGDESFGSIDYALHNLAESLRLVVVLGHSGCGAVTATVDLFLDPANYLDLRAHHQLRAIVSSIFPAVRVGFSVISQAYGHDVRDRPGFRSALIETSIAINAAMMASTLDTEVRRLTDGRVGVVFGVYDLHSRHIGLPTASSPEQLHHSLLDPPTSAEAFEALAYDVVAGPVVRALIGA